MIYCSRLFIAGLLITISNELFCQLTAKIKYLKTIVDREVPLECDSELIIHGKKSLYVSNVGAYPVREVKYKDTGGEIHQDEKGNQVLKDFLNDKLLLRRNSYTSAYVSEESIPTFDWELENETKKMLGFKCSKAITEFRGRKYTAWYAPKIGISDGPWKFYGLPGLILEIYDNQKQVIFKAVEIEVPSEVAPIVGLQTKKRDRKVSIEDYRRSFEIEKDQIIIKSKLESDALGSNPDNFQIQIITPVTIELTFENEQNMQ